MPVQVPAVLEEIIDDPFPGAPTPEQRPEEAGPSDSGSGYEVRSFPIFRYRIAELPQALLHTAMDLTLRISAIELWRLTVGEALLSSSSQFHCDACHHSVRANTPEYPSTGSKDFFLGVKLACRNSHMRLGNWNLADGAGWLGSASRLSLCSV